MTAPKVVFRIGKLKSWGEIGAAAAHNLRTRPTPNAGAGGFVDLVPLTMPPADAVRAKIGEQTIRKTRFWQLKLLPQHRRNTFDQMRPSVLDIVIQSV